MSTLPGLASKGEKGKSKFQSLDINSLYRVSRGEPLEKQQQKSTVQHKYGMQTLGKVPNTRRGPVNLPSLKSEHSGSDTAVSLVPTSAPGWGKQDVTSSTTTTSSSTSTVTSSSANSATTASAHQAAIALPVSTAIPQNNKQATPVATPATTDKSWSSVMSGADLLHPPPYQSPQFQHEFPSLSSGDGGISHTGSDIQYGPGPSLRPQTEGSWIQGGSRAPVDGPPRNSSDPLGAPPQLQAQVGLPLPQQPLPPQFRGVMPQFMVRNSFPSNGPGINNIPTPPPNSRARGDNRPPSRHVDPDEIAHRPIIKEEDLNRMDDMTRDVGWASHEDIDYNQKLAFSDDESGPEKGSRKDSKSSQFKEQRSESYSQDSHSRSWYGSRGSSGSQSSSHRGRLNEEEDSWVQRKRQQHSEELAMAVERAKQRKEEEEKRFLESKQAAAKKLKELDEKLSKGKRDKDSDETQGTINPSVVPPQPITPAPIPVPEWERERDRESRSRTPNAEDKPREGASDFRQLTQIEGRNFARKDSRSADRVTREREREMRDGGYSRHYQADIPPRFQRQLRNNPASNAQQPQMPPFQHQYDGRWMQGGQMGNKTTQGGFPRKLQEVDEKETDDEHKQIDYRRQGSDDSYRTTSHRSYSDSSRKSSDNRYSGSEEGRDYRNAPDYEYKKEEDKWEKERITKKQDEEQSMVPSTNEDWHIDRRDKYRQEKMQDVFERPQRPDSRDSRASRESRHSHESARESEVRDFHDHGSWVDTPFQTTYEDKKKDLHKEDRRQVPGPITKERIEADDLKNEKRGLTQLKRGQLPEKKITDMKKDDAKDVDDSWNIHKKRDNMTENAGVSKPWADAVSSSGSMSENQKFMDALEKPIKNYVASVESIKEEAKSEIDGKKSDKSAFDASKDSKRGGSSRNNRPDMQGGRSQNWGTSGYFYNRSSWTKRTSGRGGGRSGGPPRPSSAKSGEWVATDSEGSMDEVSVSTESGKDDRGLQKSPKPVKKLEKDEKNKEIKHEKAISERRSEKHDNRRDNYVPRGEPSKHGRGGYFRRGGLSKRIDGYGPPPSKSPFGHPDEKDRKTSGDENSGDTAASEEKSKLGQGGVRRETAPYTARKGDEKLDRSKSRKGSDPRRLKPKGKNSEDAGDTNSENSDESNEKERKKALNRQATAGRSGSARRNAPPPRLSGEKRGNYGASKTEMLPTRQGSSGSLRSTVKKEGPLKGDDKTIESAAGVDSKNKENVDGEVLDAEVEDKSSAHGDSDGFQEVKSKKTVKERQKSVEEKPTGKSVVKQDKEVSKLDRKVTKTNGTATQLTPQQISNIPSLMATPVNPPAVLPQTSNKNQFDRPRQNKLPPRFAKQKENNRLHKVHLQQSMCDVNDINKVNQSINMYAMKDPTNPMSMPLSNAWDKPLTPQLRNSMEQDAVLGVSLENCKTLDQVQSPVQSSSPNNDKAIGKSSPLQDKAVLDGTTPPVNTIIFENTNFKSAPGSRNVRNDKSRSKLEDDLDNTVIGFNKPIAELLNKTEKQEAIQIQLTFNSKEDNADMKLDFFETEISHLTEEKSSKNLVLPRSMHPNVASTISPSTADALNFKIQSVKKVWETSMPTVIEHSVGQDDGNSSFTSSFGPDPNSLDPSGAFSKSADTPDDNHEGYSPSPNQVASNSTTNVCKVKPTQQVAGSGGQAVLNTGNHQQHSGIVGPGLMGHQLSPPPMQPVIGAGVGLGQPPQQYTTNQHIGYQPSLGGSTQYGMSAIPSPPTVLFNSTQQIQAQTGLYGHFSIDQTGVIGGQGRSQYSQYPYNLGQTGSSHYSAQSMYLQTAQPHPPPTAQAPPDMYSNINSYRLPATGPFGQNQQLNNPTTVLISSTSNSLMSATVKPSSQQISAIGTKAGGVGQAYQPQSQQGQQLYMAYDPTIQANYMPSTGVIQRGPAGPVQNNVVPALQPSSSYYSGSTGGQTGYFQQPGNSTLQSAQLQQHQAGYGLQGNVFGTHNQSHTSPSLQGFNSHFLSTPIQIAAALNAQQYRSQNLQTTAYLKGVGSQGIGDQGGRPQQLKSPGSQQEVLSSVFNSAPQIPSPKSRQNCKQPPPQPSPTSQHKYNLYQGVTNQQTGQAQRYPTPIQRPVNFPPSIGSMQNSGSNSQKHRSNNTANNKTPTRQYYSAQGNNLSSQNEKNEDAKLASIVTPSTTNSNIVTSTSNSTKTSIGNVSTGVVNQTEIVKENITKEEAVSLKE